MEIERLVSVSDEVVESLGKLLIQLSPNGKSPTREYLHEMLSLSNIFLFLAKEDGKIIGTFTLVLYKIPTGIKASIEDVVVDVDMRGKQIGEKMIRFAIDYAGTQLGVTKIDLTSSPSRIAANALYQKLGFVKRETNVYRFKLK
ncbi:GNAT family N-acetyltransferase [Dysgonomonas alginatilytica]|nr:GNAT family N-acetyltransferase [Dysgonomonas alginatilytica]